MNAIKKEGKFIFPLFYFKFRIGKQKYGIFIENGVK